MNDNELFEQARRRVQRKIKGRCVTNKDVIVDQEKEILYYRNKIERLTEQLKLKKDIELNKKLEVTINKQDYLIKYHNKTDMIKLNVYLIKLINEEDKIYIAMDNEFKIINKQRYNIKERALQSLIPPYDE